MNDNIFVNSPLFPLNVMIEVSNYCNQSCCFCSNVLSKRKRQLIDDTLARKIIVCAYNLGSRIISFHGMGEPLINNNLSEYISLAKKTGYTYIYIDTNGALATLDKIKPIIHAGLDSIKFSVGAANEDTYKIVHGRNDYNKVINNIGDLIKYKEDNNCKIKLIIDFCETKHNVGQDVILKTLFGDGIDEFWISDCSNQAGEIDNSLIALEGREEDYLCTEPFDRMTITANGKVTACCMDNDDRLVYDVLDFDLNEKTLLEAWKKADTIRISHITGENVPNKCMKCDFVKYYQKT